MIGHERSAQDAPGICVQHGHRPRGGSCNRRPLPRSTRIRIRAHRHIHVPCRVGVSAPGVAVGVAGGNLRAVRNPRRPGGRVHESGTTRQLLRQLHGADPGFHWSVLRRWLASFRRSAGTGRSRRVRNGTRQIVRMTLDRRLRPLSLCCPVCHLTPTPQPSDRFVAAPTAPRPPAPSSQRLPNARGTSAGPGVLGDRQVPGAVWRTSGRLRDAAR